MISMLLFLGLMLLFTLLLGKVIEKIRVPWIFAALLLGSLLAIYNPFETVTSSETFDLLAHIGMYLLLFMIGFKLDLKKLDKNKKFIIKSTFFIILFEAFFGTLLIHYVFNYNWIISFIVSLSFATVGEAILIPILDEFNITNTKLGQSIIGIGALDDIIEIIALLLTMFLVGSMLSYNISYSIGFLIPLFVLLIITFLIIKFNTYIRKIIPLDNKKLFLIMVFILFLFVAIGSYSNAAPIAALLSGIAVKAFTPRKVLEIVENNFYALAYGFFVPIFFLWVGMDINMNYLANYIILVLLVVLVSNSAKILSSYIVGRKELGFRKSILLGIGLSIRFSTSITIIKILFENGLIQSGLYSVIIASSIIFKFIIPVLFSNLLVKWNISKK